MSRRLDQENEVLDLASELGLEWQSQPVKNIVDYCLRKIKAWVNDSGPLTTIKDLERLICQKLQLVFEEVWTDADLNRIISRYVALGEVVFASLKDEFDEDTFATLLQRRYAAVDSPDRYVAVIDCRGAKAARRFFTRWHEIAHLLTLPHQLQFHFHRTSTDRCPIERLMDTIAGEVGFYEPIFTPALNAELRVVGRLSFSSVEVIRDRFYTDASLQATLFAAVRRCPTPIIYVEAGLGYKKHEAAKLRSRQLSLFPETPPIPKLRILRVSSNEAARKSGLRIDRNMKVPATSLIAKLAANDATVAAGLEQGTENLSIWRHSDGSALGFGAIDVQARAQGECVAALIQPASE